MTVPRSVPGGSSGALLAGIGCPSPLPYPEAKLRFTPGFAPSRTSSRGSLTQHVFVQACCIPTAMPRWTSICPRLVLRQSYSLRLASGSEKSCRNCLLRYDAKGMIPQHVSTKTSPHSTAGTEQGDRPRNVAGQLTPCASGSWQAPSAPSRLICSCFPHRCDLHHARHATAQPQSPRPYAAQERIRRLTSDQRYCRRG